METSDFISADSASQSVLIQRIERIAYESKTSECFVVRIDGKEYYMKKLRDEFAHDVHYRNLIEKEYEIGHNINHPNIVKHISLNEDGNGYYILMENVVGETLDRFVQSHPHYFKSRGNLDKFFLQLLDALKCLHENHIVYSDLKPQNIMLTQVNNDVKIVDFGFCFTDSSTNTVGTTKGFSAPEHVENGLFDVSTDTYGVGKIIEYIARNVSYSLPGVYDKIMMRCLKEKQQDRFQTTDEVVRLINRRNNTIKKAVVWSVVALVLFVGYRTIQYNEHFNAWWDSFELFTTPVEYDVNYRDTYYRILSEEAGTCEVVGQSSLPNVYLHDSVVINGKSYRLTHIADSAFMKKRYIKSISIPDGVVSIGKEAFRECKNITTINLPNSVREIDDYAFYGCSGVTYLRLSPAITLIPTGAFAGTNIKRVDIPEGVTVMKLDAFGNCTELQEVTLPSTLMTLERGVFWNCPKLKSITLPANVTSLGEYLFFHCDSLTDIYNLATTPQKIPPIHKNPSQITLHVPTESVEAYRNAPYWQEMKVVSDE